MKKSIESKERKLHREQLLKEMEASMRKKWAAFCKEERGRENEAN